MIHQKNEFHLLVQTLNTNYELRLLDIPLGSRLSHQYY